MLEPTETESRETLDDACDLFLAIEQEARENPEILHSAPNTRTVGRPDEVSAARNPILRYPFE
jgi:glycine dehydrogenase subunit 2